MSTSLSRRSSTTAHPSRQQLEELDALLKRMLDLPVHRLDDETEGEGPSAGAADQGEHTAHSAQTVLRGPHRANMAREADAIPGVNYQTADEDEADLKPRVVFADPATEEAEQPAAQPETTAAPPSQKEDWVPLTSTWKPSARTWKPLSEAWQQAKTGGHPASALPAAPVVTVAAAPMPSPPAEENAAIQEKSLVSVVETMAPLTAADASPALASADSGPPASPPPVGAPWFLWPFVLFNIVFDAFLRLWGAPGRWLRGAAGRWFLAALGVLCLAAAGALTAADWFGWTW